jgi:hypothetical protein
LGFFIHDYSNTLEKVCPARAGAAGIGEAKLKNLKPLQGFKFDKKTAGKLPRRVVSDKLSKKNYILYLYLFCKKFKGSNPKIQNLIRFDSAKILYNISTHKL